MRIGKNIEIDFFELFIICITLLLIVEAIFK